MDFDRIGAKKGALKGLRDYARGELGKELKGLKGEDPEALEVTSVSVEGGDVPEDEVAEELTAAEGEDLPLPVEDITTEDEGEISPELLERLLAELEG